MPLRGMVEAAREIGRSFVAITDHSQGLRIANGMDATRLAAQGLAIDRLNAELAGQGDPFRVLRSMEMDVLPDGSSDMEPDALAPLDMVLGAFHSKLRVPDDQTERYLTALRNPDVQILAHPRARMFGKRVGLLADWSKVFDEAARMGKALELDATPARQDLDVELARLAMRSGVRWFSIGSDAHSAAELGALRSAWPSPRWPRSLAIGSSTIDRPTSSRGGRLNCATHVPARCDDAASEWNGPNYG